MRNQRARPRPGRGDQFDEYTPRNHTSKGWMVAKFIKSAHDIIPLGVNLCPDFAFKARECLDSRQCGTKHFYALRQLAMQDLESIGDTLLSTRNVGFVMENIENYLMQ